MNTLLQERIAMRCVVAVVEFGKSSGVGVILMGLDFRLKRGSFPGFLNHT